MKTVRVSESFELLPIIPRPGGIRTSPYLRIQVRPGKMGSSATVKLSSSARSLLGIGPSDKNAHVQVYLSTIGIKVSKCRVDSDHARRVNTDGKFVCHEVIDALGLDDGDIWDCDAYLSDPSTQGKGSSVIGSFPMALRDKITGIDR